jgi:SSS family solute:Na+ symporter
VDKLNFVPDFNDMDLLVPLFLIPLAVQWWSTWYPGAEPGGGGYIAQRMLSAKEEKDAVKATLLFNITHYAIRPWPWILIALASLIVYPDLDSIAQAFPNIEADKIGNDLAFPAMLTKLPSGLVGLLLAALIAALMSTISTHLNWGSSYIVNDFYGRFINRKATESSKVMIGRVSTVILMVLAAFVALYLQNAKQAFDILLQIGAGTGLLFILRWFWWRINAYSEIVAMIVSFFIAFYFERMYDGDLLNYEKMCIGVLLTSIAWVVATYVTPATDQTTLQKFYTKIQPKGSGWNPIISSLSVEQKEEISLNGDPGLTSQILMMLLGCAVVYTALFGSGWVLLGSPMIGAVTLVISAVLAYVLFKMAFGKES